MDTSRVEDRLDVIIELLREMNIDTNMEEPSEVIIYCEDCKFSHRDTDGVRRCREHRNIEGKNRIVNDDDFCSFAE